MKEVRSRWSWIVNIPDLSPGPHTFTINYYLDDPLHGKTWIATATTTVHIARGEPTSVDFPFNLLSFPDEDGDSITNFDELGFGTNPFEPLASVSQVSAGGDHTCTIKLDQSLWCWGRNSQGQLGDETRTDRKTPIQVGTDTDWRTVSAGGGFGHTCAIKLGGTLWCWGADTFRIMMGLEPSTNERIPRQMGSDTDWLRVASGMFGTCGIKIAGTIFCWGESVSNFLVPTMVGVETDWSDTSLAGVHPCATKADGSLYCWGMESSTQIQTDPIQVGSDTDWRRAAAGNDHKCAIKFSGALFCWGDNELGQLGDGTNVERLTPVQVGTDNDWRDIFVGGGYTCGQKDDESFHCWGLHQLEKYGNQTNIPTHIEPVVNWKKFSAGDHACAIDMNEKLWCWGNNSNGELGDNRSSHSAVPVQESSFDTTWIRLSSGGSHSCATKLDGTLWCWGANDFGQLGNGSLLPGNIPDRVGTESDWLEVTVGEAHTCAIKTNKTLYCWGRNSVGQLGDGFSSIMGRSSPVQEFTSGTNWVSLSAGQNHTCAHCCPVKVV